MIASPVETAAQPPRAALSQWQLIRLRFSKHRVAVASIYPLALLYFIALFAEFIAPYSPGWKNVNYSYCPPQIPQFSLSKGFYVYRMNRTDDPVTLQPVYTADLSRPVKIGFFTKGEPYQFFGRWTFDRHFYGVRETTPEGEAVAPLYLFGADRLGRDLASRVIHGSRISLSIGLVAIVFTCVLGLFFGGVSGYFGGKVDTIIQRLIEVVNSFPHLPLWLAIGAIVPREWSPLQTYFATTIVLSLLAWTGLARVVRGKILASREEDYAVAARLLGASHARILFRHLMPGCTSHIIVVLTFSVPAMILGETALSFLGLGLRPPIVSWGVLLQDCLNLQVLVSYPWLLMPVIWITLTVLAFNFVGDGLRDAADPYGK